MCRQTLAVLMCMHSDFPAGRSEQTIVMSFHDVMRISCAKGQGNYKRRALLNLRAVIWVFWYKVFRSVDEPQTLYFGCLSASHGEEHIQNRMCDLFIHMHVPRPFWEPLVSVCVGYCLKIPNILWNLIIFWKYLICQWDTIYIFRLFLEEKYCEDLMDDLLLFTPTKNHTWQNWRIY